MSWHVVYELGTICGERKGCSQAGEVAQLVGCLCGKHKPLSVFNPWYHIKWVWWCTQVILPVQESRGTRGADVQSHPQLRRVRGSRLTWARDAVLLVCQAVDENLVNAAVHTHLTSLYSPFLPPFAHRPSLWRFSFCAKEQCKRGLEKGNICIWGGAGQPATHHWSDFLCTGVVNGCSVHHPVCLYLWSGGAVSIPFWAPSSLHRSIIIGWTNAQSSIG